MNFVTSQVTRESLSGRAIEHDACFPTVVYCRTSTVEGGGGGKDTEVTLKRDPTDGLRRATQKANVKCSDKSASTQKL